MLRRTVLYRNDNMINQAPTWKSGKTLKNYLGDVLHSPYKEAFKDYWATPVPWMPREYGAKPKPGDPIPLRDSGTMLILARNNHITHEQLAEEEDYKVLINHRESRGRYQRDHFIVPTSPVGMQDRSEDWVPLFDRLGVKYAPEDLPMRIAAIRATLTEMNLLVLPPEGGQLAEVEGPPGGMKKWQSIIERHPEKLRDLLDILEIPYENALKSLMPFRRIQTPDTEPFRFDTVSYLLTLNKMPDVRFIKPMLHEFACWVSPSEALKRMNAGVMHLPTPTAYLMRELQAEFPRFEMVQQKRNHESVPELIVPEMVHCPKTRMGTVIFPGDLHHSGTEAMMVGKEGDDASKPRLNRFHYVKDDPFGTRAIYFDREVRADDEVELLTRTPAREWTIEGQEAMTQLPSTIADLEDFSDVDVEGSEAEMIGAMSRAPLRSQLNRKQPGLNMLDESERRSAGLEDLPTEIEERLARSQHGSRYGNDNPFSSGRPSA